MEREVKLTLLTPGACAKLVEHFAAQGHVPEVLHQHNQFYTSPEIRRAKVSVRVRTEEGKTILTTKVKKSCENGYFQTAENNYPLRDASEFTDHPEKYLDPAFVAEIRPWFAFDNVRTALEVEGFRLELDRVQPQGAFGGYEELECETETPEAYERFIFPVLERLGIAFEPSRVQKVLRVGTALGAFADAPDAQK